MYYNAKKHTQKRPSIFVNGQRLGPVLGLGLKMDLKWVGMAKLCPGPASALSTLSHLNALY